MLFCWLPAFRPLFRNGPASPMACLKSGATDRFSSFPLRRLPDFGTMAAGTAGLVMRCPSTVALAAALVMAVTSICFIAITSTGGGALGHQLCTFGGPLCNCPSLLLIPTVVSLAWALMLKIDQT